MNINDWLNQQSARIPTDTPRLDAELLLAARLGKSRAYLFAFADEAISSENLAQLECDIKQLASGYPLAYLLGKKAFWDMELRVTEATLIPRADTETLLEIAETLFPHDTRAKMIDLGTGSGAIAIALSRIFPHAHITATDMSTEALAVAQENAKAWQGAEVHFMQNSWLAGFDADSFDLIASNPPYIEENDPHLAALRYEPISALTAPQRGLADIQCIISQAQTVLKPHGWLLLEHGYDQGQAVRDLLSGSPWPEVQTRRDLGGNERITMAKKKAK